MDVLNQVTLTEMRPVRNWRSGDSTPKYFRLFGQYHSGGVSSVSFTPNSDTLFVYEFQRVFQIPTNRIPFYVKQREQYNTEIRHR